MTRDDIEPEDVPLTEAFWSVAGALRHLAGEAFAPLDITPGHARALRVLGRHGQMRLRDLSQHLRIAPRSTTEVVDDLEARHLVTRTPDPHDRRAVLVELSDAGRRTNAQVARARTAQAEAFFGRLDDADRAHLARILGTLRENLPEGSLHGRERGGRERGGRERGGRERGG